MLTCAFKTQVNKSNIEIIYWNMCIKFNLSLFDHLNAQNLREYFSSRFLNMCSKSTSYHYPKRKHSCPFSIISNLTTLSTSIENKLILLSDVSIVI